MISLSSDDSDTRKPFYCIAHQGVELSDQEILSLNLRVERPGYYWCEAGHYQHVSTERINYLRRLAHIVLSKVESLPINILSPLAAGALFGLAAFHMHHVGNLTEIFNHFGCWVATHTTNGCATPPQY